MPPRAYALGADDGDVIIDKSGDRVLWIDGLTGHKLGRVFTLLQSSRVVSRFLASHFEAHGRITAERNAVMALTVERRSSRRHAAIAAHAQAVSPGGLAAWADAYAQAVKFSALLRASHLLDRTRRDAGGAIGGLLGASGLTGCYAETLSVRWCTIRGNARGITPGFGGEF